LRKPEGEVEETDVVFEDPLEVFEVLGVDVLHILDAEGLAEDVFVEGPGEVSVQHVAVVQGLA